MPSRSGSVTVPADAADAADRPRVRADLVALEGYHSPQVDVAVRLNTNESPFPPPPGFAAAVADEVARVEWHRYPDRAATDLRAGIAEIHGVDVEQVFAANGSNEVLQTLCLAYAGAGRSVAVFEPTYRLHSHIASVAGATVVVGHRGPDLALDHAEVHRLLDASAPALTFLCSPNNPTGMTEDPDVVRAVVDRGVGITVVDEAYGQFGSWSALDLVGESRSLVVVRTFSKTWSMAAARLGYLVGPSWLVAELEKVVLPYHLDAVTQIAGRVALRFAEEMTARVELIVAERRRVELALAGLGLTTWPSDANFILFRSEHRSGDELWADLVARSVLVRNTASWPGLAGCLRVTIGTPDENDAFLGAMKEVLS